MDDSSRLDRISDEWAIEAFCEHCKHSAMISAQHALRRVGYLGVVGELRWQLRCGCCGARRPKVFARFVGLRGH